MADETPSTNPTAPGASTTEFKLTLLATVIGTVMEGAAGVLHSLQDAGITAPWFTIALLVAGMLLQLSSVFGYVKGRVLLKAAMIASDVPANPK